MTFTPAATVFLSVLALVSRARAGWTNATAAASPSAWQPNSYVWLGSQSLTGAQCTPTYFELSVAASLNLVFNGTRLQVFGRKSDEDGVTVATVDGERIPLSNAQEPTSAEQCVQILDWSSDDQKTSNQHTLAFTTPPGAPTTRFPTITYATFFTPDNVSATQGADHASDAAGPSSTTAPTTIASSSQSSSPSAGVAVESKSHSRSSFPAIVGAICGILALFLLALLAFFWRRRRNARSTSQRPSSPFAHAGAPIAKSSPVDNLKLGAYPPAYDAFMQDATGSPRDSLAYSEPLPGYEPRRRSDPHANVATDMKLVM
ncbi:hypothetical protein EXIGLDRAFT_837846 [Exidia glandulosa HHB12029]|uniref:Mid2 domain-containing protein n=1 Tax=Exidia glandulosa HHB12029 TaxID=1314781 RepID=A0A165GDW1_EXIGL|nr:hypothetical protein EXIGLDRAFT_837846 [Exidia glandulosa HHB12029]